MAKEALRPVVQALDEAALRALVAPGEGWRVSIYLPLQPAFPPAKQNALVQRQAVDELRARLRERGLEEAEVARLAEGLAAVSTDPRDLGPHVGSLAVLLDGGAARVFPLVAREPYAVHVARSFRLRPLLRALGRERRYRALALSANRVALFEGDARGLRPTPSDALPESLVAALGPERVGREVEVRGGAPGAGAAYHGRGSPGEERALDLERYHRAVADGLARELAGAAEPLVLVADATHQSGLRALARLPALLDEGVLGNPDYLSPEDLHARAWPIVEASLERAAAEGLGAFERARNHQKGVDLLDDVAAAAVAGRIHRLWIEAERQLPGRVREDGRIEDGQGDDDLLEDLAALVLARGGRVHVVDAAAMPSQTGAAAELR